MNEHDFYAMTETMLKAAHSQPLSALLHIGPLLDWLEEHNVRGTDELRGIYNREATRWVTDVAMEATGLILRQQGRACSVCGVRPFDSNDEHERCRSCINRNL